MMPTAIRLRPLAANLTLLLAACVALSACDPAEMQQAQEKKKKRVEQNRTACTFEIERMGMQRGLMAKQIIADGKVRGTPVIYWSTPDFTGVNKISAKPGEPPFLQVALGWRLGELEGGAAYSPLDAMIVRAKDLPASNVPAGSFWRVSIVDNETHEIEYRAPEAGQPIEARFTPEGGGGMVLPDIITDALGGINGGRFELALVSPDGTVLARRDVRPVRGYEFKELALKAEAGVKPLTAKPETCTAPASF